MYKLLKGYINTVVNHNNRYSENKSPELNVFNDKNNNEKKRCSFKFKRSY